MEVSSGTLTQADQNMFDPMTIATAVSQAVMEYNPIS
jgi:hypothetical protein